MDATERPLTQTAVNPTILAALRQHRVYTIGELLVFDLVRLQGTKGCRDPELFQLHQWFRWRTWSARANLLAYRPLCFLKTRILMLSVDSYSCC